jgi:hypothetical protein
VAGGLGLAGLVVGGITGGLALSKSGETEDQCRDASDGVALCTHEGKVAGDAAKTLGLVSTIGFGVGIAGVGVAAVLLLTEPPAPRAASARRPLPRAGWVRAGVLAAGETGAIVGLRGGF